MRSLCNIQTTLNKKGDCYCSHHPQTSPRLSSVLDVLKDNAGDPILVIIFLITKT